MSIGIAIALLGTCLAAAPLDETLTRYDYVQVEMGVPFRVSLYSPDEETAIKATQAAYARVQELNRILSDYDRDSELMQLCRASGPGRPVKASPELRLMLSKSLEFARRTDGAFDPTVGPLVELWRKARRRKTLPNPDALADARRRVGWRHVRLDDEAGTVELLKEGMRLDFGGIAKGYAADEMLRVLREHGLPRALIDAGGDLVVGNPPPERDGWKIGIAPLSRPDEAPDRFLLLSNVSVATSGDAYQHVEIAGTRYSHLIDPQTGLGLTRPSSITVIAPDGTTADALASAVSVLGPERGLKLIENTEGTATLIVELEEGRPRLFVSKRFTEFEASDEP